ncbi:hypothetical protein OPV22_033762 [Ensete ventricosum]|uniref:Uncharacterized protein n=1 Tax=Ensete ventricosum TaxID=4639 RepID=A0AAV8P3M4_ENSVE|nr:hypothetical protein OPV22_033762 [Ensete ventricosum]
MEAGSGLHLSVSSPRITPVAKLCGATSFFHIWRWWKSRGHIPHKALAARGGRRRQWWETQPSLERFGKAETKQRHVWILFVPSTTITRRRRASLCRFVSRLASLTSLPPPAPL